ncbi:MAG TPA: EAL domain-containing protein [Nitrosomonas sp.]|nr:EAL domain-containing protein [Nitrosomonas sp.]HRB98322.1 EAL domain-containing protein [Nitrosomonas sp.]
MSKSNLKILTVGFSEEESSLLRSELVNIQLLKNVCNMADIESALNERDWDVMLSNHDSLLFNSIDAFNLLIESNKDIPFIIYSNESDDDTIISALHCGVNDYVQKDSILRLAHVIEKEVRNVEVRRERNRTQNQIFRLAYYDELTGLPKWNLFFEESSSLLAEIAKSNANAGFYLVNVERITHVNGIYDPSIGDLLIKQISSRLSTLVNHNCLLTRINDCQFAFFNAEVTDSESVQNFANQIIKLAISPILINKLEFYVTLNIGVCVYPADGKDVAKLFTNAENTLLNTQYLWKNSCMYYTKEISKTVARRLELKESLFYAIEDKELLLHYQPIVDLESGNLTGVEALVRWHHPKFGMLLPEKFIPLAKETGLIVDLSKWVLKQACKQARMWHEAGFKSLSMTINISAIEFDQAKLIGHIEGVLAETGMPPELLELDIAESVLMQDAEMSVKILQSLKEIGVRIAIDDFGIGYSSMSYLKHFPIDILKIDRSLTHDIIFDSNSSEIILAIIGLARSLNYSVLAEGIETKEQFDFLYSLKCNRAQGYLFSKPIPAEEILLLLEHRNS